MVTARTAVGFPELPRRSRNLPDWSNADDVRNWTFRPVQVRPRAQLSPLMLMGQHSSRWSTDPETVNRVYQWMRKQGWGQGV